MIKTTRFILSVIIQAITKKPVQRPITGRAYSAAYSNSYD